MISVWNKSLQEEAGEMWVNKGIEKFGFPAKFSNSVSQIENSSNDCSLEPFFSLKNGLP